MKRVLVVIPARDRDNKMFGHRQKTPAFTRFRAYVIRNGEVEPLNLSIRGGRKCSAEWMRGLSAGRLRRKTLAVGPRLGSSTTFIANLISLSIPFVALTSPSGMLALTRDKRKVAFSRIYLRHDFRLISLRDPSSGMTVTYGIVDLGNLGYKNSLLRLYAVKKGNVNGARRDLQFVITQGTKLRLRGIVEAVVWIKRASRVTSRLTRTTPVEKEAIVPALGLAPRMNHRHAGKVDRLLIPSEIRGYEGRLHERTRVKNVAELFAGAGGFGLGFLMSRSSACRYRLIYSADINPVYVETLRRNHSAFATFRIFQNIATANNHHEADLNSEAAMRTLRRQIRNHGPVDILIGGPPCQGFSIANRNSGSIDNPHNACVDTFVDYVEAFQPRVFLMENVQGILWAQRTTAAGNGRSLVGKLARRLRSAGYLCFPKLLDAVWYGVPQYRTRFFLIGIREDLGLSEKDFGTWGPFPVPSHGPGSKRVFTTVRDAISDLPSIGNGYSVETQEYAHHKRPINPFVADMRQGLTSPVITGHVTSKHSEYVLKRFKKIPPGGNWESIGNMLSNYTDPSRTHSNIYRRLTWDQPSITIGNYRKLMLVHPEQHRGLSLREACRLQSFPDWFEFAGSLDGRSTGLSFKQQQLANAVAPLLSRAIAEFLTEI